MPQEIAVVDFETHEILQRPHYPPDPVGVSIIYPGEKHSRYFAWGHPEGNNCAKEEAVQRLSDLWKNPKIDLLFHHAKFDLAVAHEKLGLPIPEWDRVHDTMFLLFLANPYLPNFKLKPAAELLLKMAPTERDTVRDWLIDHQPVSGVRIGKGNFGKYIAFAPGSIVGPYADGDTIRTLRLFKKLMPDIRKRSMLEAYDRERRLVPILMENEIHGVRVNLVRLRSMVDEYSTALYKADGWIGKRLGVKGLDLNKDAEVAQALYDAGVVLEFNETSPGSGKPSVSKDNLTLDMFTDKRVYYVFGYRNRLATALQTFMRPWLRMAEASGGRIYTSWKQIKGEGGGAVTGRMASSPNFQNIMKDMEGRKNEEWEHPAFLSSLPHLPLLRTLILPDVKELLLDRDFSQQEVRIAAHYEDGPLLAAFNENPKFDLHDYVDGVLKSEFGIDIGRSAVKTLNFGMLYGMGATGVANKLGIERKEATKLIKAQKTAIPGVVELDRSLKELARDNQPFRTWGGREYYCEPPAKIKGVQRTFEYKMINTLVQGSAADCTKQAIINYAQRCQHGHFLLQVHDELLVTVSPQHKKTENALLREAMLDVDFDVPMLSTCKMGLDWGTLRKVKE